ncbi:chloride channel protein [Adlercreutzia faecimuris]|uniref:Chloride channel protein n=1 Tax=Adlercreutzia faecimuris TaxID=2897341 RepID=A0ABS9WGI1_9ACTN|nr:chloride channel protein [Adlercreutzia sp. JBNU-10]MCI2241351.1 chloride channel protein [Adlercreutzia sp. JBNU-10]
MVRRILFAVLTVAFGAFAGAFAWAFFFLMNTGIDLLWHRLPAALAGAGLPPAAYPIMLCTLGGVAIGLFHRRHGDLPDDMNAVLAQVRATGRYGYDRLGASFAGALLPLLFGGSVGPEAGLTGVIAGLCTWVGDRLRFVGAEMRELADAGTAAVVSAVFAAPLFGMAVPLVGAADDSEGRGVFASEVRLGASKPLKAVVYVLAVAGALGAMALLRAAFGGGGGLPHFSAVALGVPELAWALPIAAAGAAAGWLFFPCGALARWLAGRLGARPVAQGVLAGAVLGLIGAALPFALFAGEAQVEVLAGEWTGLAAGTLIATGFAKVLATQLCLGLGWRGGHFFPIIFAGISIGYGCAALTGVDPTFALCVASAALMGAVMRQPVMTALLLFLVFPVKAAPALLVAAALGAMVPVPARWMGSEAPRGRSGSSSAAPSAARRGA